MSRPVAAVVLAAGEGARFGGPKALAIRDGRTFLQIAIERLREAEFDRIAVVLGAEAANVRRDPSIDPAIRDCATSGARLTFDENPAWIKGRTGSIACGLAAMPAEARGALIHQVDFPCVAAATFLELAAAFDRTPEAEERILLPVHEGRRGHPIVIGRAFWPAIREMGSDEPLRNLIHRIPARLVEIRVGDPGIHINQNERDTAGEAGAEPERRERP